MTGTTVQFSVSWRWALGLKKSDKMGKAPPPCWAKLSVGDLVILNHYLEAGSLGLELAPALKRAAPRTKLVLFSSYDLAIEAQHESAVDVYVNKRRLASLLPTVSSLLDLAG